MIVQVTVKTPKNQAERSMQTQKSAILGYKEKKKLIDEKLVSHNEFWWKLEIEDDELPKLIKNTARGEVLIRKFYQTLFKLLGRAQKLQLKFKKGGQWIKNYLKKKLSKTKGNEDMIAHIDSMKDEELTSITDKEEIQALINGQMITVEKI